jgi:hypothetical protein
MAKSQEPFLRSNKNATRQGGSDSEFGFLEWRGINFGAIDARVAQPPSAVSVIRFSNWQFWQLI